MTAKLYHFIIFIYIVHLSNCEPCHAAVELSEFNFDKFVNKFYNTVVKFDIAFPYGVKHSQFCKFCMEYNYLDNLLCGLIGVKDYGDKDNTKLAKKYGIQHVDDFPAIKMFGNHTKNWYDFSSKDNPITVDNLIRFVQSYSNFKIHLKGCIPELDKLTQQFLSIIHTTRDAEECNNIINEVRRINLINDRADIQILRDFYLKLMTKILKDNHRTNIIEQQLQRLSKLKLAKSVSTIKLQEFNYKLNILHVFKMYDIEMHSKKKVVNKIDL